MLGYVSMLVAQPPTFSRHEVLGRCVVDPVPAIEHDGLHTRDGGQLANWLGPLALEPGVTRQRSGTGVSKEHEEYVLHSLL